MRREAICDLAPAPVPRRLRFRFARLLRFPDFFFLLLLLHHLLFLSHPPPLFRLPSSRPPAFSSRGWQSASSYSGKYIWSLPLLESDRIRRIDTDSLSLSRPRSALALRMLCEIFLSAVVQENLAHLSMVHPAARSAASPCSETTRFDRCAILAWVQTLGICYLLFIVSRFLRETTET